MGWLMGCAFAASSYGEIYYVNDSSIVGDVYCVAAGVDAAGRGTNAASPMLSLANLLASYALAPGDTVLIDTGIYSNQTVTVTAADAGAGGTNVVFQGSTNLAAGGSIFQAPSAAQNVFTLSGVSNVTFRHLDIRSSQYGFNMAGQRCLFESMTFVSNAAAFFGGGSNMVMRQCIAVANTRALWLFNDGAWFWDGGVFWNNAAAAKIEFNSYRISISNSVVSGGSLYQAIGSGGTVVPPSGDYNVLWNVNLGGTYVSLYDLQRVVVGSWRHSTWADPLFVNGSGGDFHERSLVGTYTNGSFVTYTNHSPLIDFCESTHSSSQEPQPNGTNRNAGLYGDTPQAAKSLTNAWLFATALNDGGEVTGVVNLAWAGGNFTNGATVQIDYSIDNGATWVAITNGVPVTNRLATWNVAAVTSTPTALWRVAGQSPAFSHVADTNDRIFTIRGLGANVFYVNDTNAVGDLYCTGIGHATNAGLDAASPALSLQQILDAYDVAPGDTVYMDTGRYTGQTVTLSVQDQGVGTNFVVIQGSTNAGAGGTIIDRQNSTQDVFVLNNSGAVNLRNLTLQRGRYGLYLQGAACRMEAVAAVSNQVGFFGFGTNHVFRRCQALFNALNSQSYGTYCVQGQTPWTWENSLFYNNTFAVRHGSLLDRGTFSNCVFVGGTFNEPLVDPPRGDYSIFWATSFGTNGSLNGLQKYLNAWWHSSVDNPQMVGGGDFHEQSFTGTYSNGVFVAYTNHSAAIDFGNPATPVGSETAPNGGRINAGPYGGTHEASRSQTNAWVQALTYRDGGTLSTPSDVIYWNAGNLPTGATVRIEFSGDAGGSWAVVTTGLLAAAGTYTWADTNFTSSRFARWRIVLESNTNIVDATPTNFIFRNGVFVYYLNDASTTGDVYASGPGSDANLGTTPTSPKFTLQSLLNTHDLEPGDIVYIDTGTYNLSSNQTITSLDGGSSNGFLQLVGSTNLAAGGTVFNRGSSSASAYALEISGAGYVSASDLVLRNAGIGLRLSSAPFARFQRVRVEDTFTDGIQVLSSSGVEFDRTILRRNTSRGLYLNGGSVSVRRGIFYRNASAAVRVDAGSVSLSNSVVHSAGGASYGYYAATTNSVTGDYNAFHLETNAVAGFIASLGRNADTLGAWSALTGQERCSLEADPLFADAPNGDFHLKTETVLGRPLPFGAGFTNDAATSPLIDAASPVATFTEEPAPNGSRADIGYFGNTPEASRGRTNAWLFAASLRHGGFVAGTGLVHWTAGGSATAGTVTVEMSLDGGANWTTVLAGVSASLEKAGWNAAGQGSTPAALWRVRHDTLTNAADAVTNFFAVRNSPLILHVNDASTAGDVYTVAPGSASNFTASAASPLDSLASVFRLYDLEPGDQILVDSGTHSNAATVAVGRHDSGATSAVVSVMGSTNGSATATTLHHGNTSAGEYGILASGAQYVAFSNLVVRGANAGIRIAQSVGIQLGRVRALDHAGNGFELVGSDTPMLRRCVSARNGARGVESSSSTSAVVEQSIIWSNTLGAVLATGGGLSISNSVLKAVATNRYVFDVQGSALLRGDCNDVLVADGARVGRIGLATYPDLKAWQDVAGQELRSLVHDPLFADGAADDFHPQSEAGRTLPTGGSTNDAANSPLIDTGAANAPYGNEPLPNGSRLNLGLYGNDAEASRSRTNGWLLALSLSSGGTARSSNTLHWVAGGVATGHLVNLQYSADGGATWTNIATGVPASTGSYVWNSVSLGSSAVSKWRVVSGSDTNIADETDSTFILNNGALTYYVNDGATTGDVYTAAPGNPANTGTGPGSPKSSIQDILDTYTLGSGDRILVDTGVYMLPQAITIGDVDTGSATNPLTIRGSTNEAAGGTVLDRQGGAYAVRVENNAGIVLQHVRITNASPAVLFSQTTNTALDAVSIFGGLYGLDLSSAPGASVRQTLIRGATRGIYQRSPVSVTIEHSVLWSNAAAIHADAGTIVVSNSVLASMAPGHLVYNLAAAAAVVADYNDLVLTNGGRVATRTLAPKPATYETVSRWARDYGQDRHSLSHDPLFADADAGDFHPQSSAFRYTALGGTTNDPVTSPLIDSGAPTAAFTNEPAPNGRRANIGIYGNHPRGSGSPTNASLRTLSLNDGGRAEGMFTLFWVAAGAATGHTVQIEYSPDNGSSWSVVTSGLPASASAYAWNTTAQTSSLFARWRISSLMETNVSATTRTNFALRNTGFTFFVNDASATGDVYCTVPGAATNSGLGTSQPADSVQQILDVYDLEGGDTILVDTGLYGPTGTVVVGELDGGLATNRLTIRGSTNGVAGGTEFTNRGFEISFADGVALCDLTVRGAATAVKFLTAGQGLVERVTAIGGATGFEVNGANSVAFSNCIARNATGQGLYLVNSPTAVEWAAGVLWSNVYGVRMESGALTLRNTALGAFSPGGAAIYYNSGALSSDYNDFHLRQNAPAGYRPTSPFATVYQNLSRWTRDFGADAHSLSHDPLFADAVAGDFHLLSVAGRWVPGVGYTNDVATSPLLDAGDPALPFAAEPAPNGGRADQGRYGNDGEASLSDTNASLLALSLNDGGRAENTFTLHWLARGDATGHTVRLDFSADGGTAWTTIVAGVGAATGSYAWNTTNFASTAIGRWRVVSEIDTNVADQTDSLFALRNAPLAFYVNDTSTTGDVYCLAIGSGAQLGVSPAAPKASIQDVIDTYDLEPGDRVYVDTGNYLLGADLTIGAFDKGVGTNRVAFIGSTNSAAGGTLIDRQGGAYGIRIEQAASVEWRHVRVQNASVGVRFYLSDAGLLQDVDVRGGSQGVEINDSDGVTLRNCSARQCGNYGVHVTVSSGALFDNGVLWSNLYGVYLNSGAITVSNSVIGAFGANRYAYYFAAGGVGSLAADYNNLFRAGGANVALVQGTPATIHQSVSRWVRDTGRDVHSLSHDPLFASPSTGDFHLQSAAGRYVPGLGYTNDSPTSLLIDAGSPLASYASEAAPNGARRDLGRYGNHPESSLSATSPSLTVVSLNDGGRVEGTNDIYWVARGAATGHTLRLEFSQDNGASWLTIATGVAASADGYVWDTTLFPNTVLGRWRVIDELATNVTDESDTLFDLRNGPISFYVNDASLVGDVYATVAGLATNVGISPATPKLSVQDVLDTYDLEPGDTVFIDTGNYTLTAAINLGQFDAGAATNRVTLQGSTNAAAGGTVLNRFGGDRCFNLNGADGVALRHVTLRNAGTAAVRWFDSDGGLIEWVRAENSTVGFDIDTSLVVTMRHCVARSSTARGLNARQSSIVWRNGVIWSNVVGCYVDGGSLTVAHSIFGAFQSAASAYFLSAGALASDYNGFFVTNGAAVATVLGGAAGGGTSRYVNVGAWFAATARDAHSLSADPKFAGASAGDFHLRSQAGRYVPGTGFVLDADTSVLIDAGDPSFSAALEPAPNGGRVNLGAFGDSTEASKSPTNSTLTAVSFNDGGGASGQLSLYWIASGNAATHTLRLSYSADGGLTFTNVAVGIPASAGTFAWDSSAFGSSPVAVWRVTSEVETNAYDQNDQPFYLRNGGGISYYVNDGSVSGDVYCTATGAATNSGYLPSAPLHSIQAVLDAYDLEPGDRVLVDTGTYNLTADITVGELDAGSATNLVTIQGSTNSAAGGTVINRQLAVTNASAILLSLTAGIHVRDVRLINAGQGVRIEQSPSCRLSGVRVESTAGAGIRVNNSASAVVSNCVVSGCAAGIHAQLSGGLLVRNSVIWNSGTALELSQSSSASVRQSVLQANGSGARVYKLAMGTSVAGDYNDLIRTNGAYLVEQALSVGGSDIFQTLTSWVIARTQEVHSLSHDPGFANAAGGDFHPASVQGRYLPGSGYVTDAVHSVLIDAGDPAGVYSNEPVPNGNRLDIGNYGNRGEASLSRTSAWVVAVSYNDGGTLAATNLLFWNSGNLPTGALLSLEYSLNHGISWATIASNVPATNGVLAWDITALSPTVLGLWRVFHEANTGVIDAVDAPFIIRTAAIEYYVNDAETTGDVYCAAPGSVTNTGGSAASPMASIQQVLDTYPLSPGDTIRVDTGRYLLTNTLVLNELVRGETDFPIRIIGSTNAAAGGTILQLVPAASSAAVVRLSQTRYVELDRLGLRGGAVGLSLQNSEHCAFSWLDIYSNTSHGISCSVAVPADFTHCVVRENSGFGLDVAAASTITWRQGVVWSNAAGPIRVDGATLTVRHAILHAPAATNFLYTLGQAAALASDYNVFWRPNGGGVGRNTFLLQSYANMAEWLSSTGQDAHTLLADPRFASPETGDFHEHSAGGRFSNGVFVADAQTSVAIDAGDPAAAYTNETVPNGTRVNIGLFGNTPEAGRSPPTPQLHPVSLADGGTVRGLYNLVWLAQGFAATGTVSLQYSANAGASWTNIATGIAASAGSYAWDPAGYASSPAARWRVFDEGDTNVVGALATNFFLRVGSVVFYVNDSATGGDIYCSAPGNAANLGLGAANPMPSLAQVLATYDLDGGDVVLIDTGIYTSTVDTIIGSLDSGVATAAVRIVGSTNWLAGGTVLDRGDSGLGSSIALSFNAAQFVNLENLTLQRAGTVIQLLQSAGIAGTNLLVRQGATGIKFDQSTGNRFAHAVVTRMTGVGVTALQSSGNALEHVVVWSNGSHAVSVAQGSISVSNSVLHARGAGRLCYASPSNGTFYSEYNDLYPEAGAAFGPDATGLSMESLPQWSLARGMDFHSLSVDPLFADAAADDYHLRSITGRFDPTSGTFVTDSNHSYLIDTGDSVSSAVDEPTPNGGRVNIGSHGARSEASMSRTNAWLLALTASSGGRLSGSVFLDWAWGGLSPTNTVRLEYSYDDGVSWTNIAAGLALPDEDYPWDSAQQVSNADVFVSSPISRWRIVLESDTNVFDMTDNYFALRNSPFVYYVNDTSTVGDVYTTAIGSDTNLGLFSYAPKATLESLLSALDVEGSDIIDIDTGVYHVTNTFGNVTAVDSGRDGLDVLIRGSTNGTRINRIAGPASALTISGPNVRLRDIVVAGGTLSVSGSSVDLTAITVTNGGLAISGPHCTVTNVLLVASPITVSAASNVVLRESTMRSSGITLTDSRNATLQNLLVYGSAAAGVNVQGNSTAFSMRNCTVAVSGNQFQMGGSSTATLENNILVADGANRFCMLPEGGILTADYNNLVARNGAWIGSRNGLWERLFYWQRESGQDLNSLSHEPLFAQEASGDYHLKSVGGRYTGGVFVADAVHSPSIDAGNPLTSVGLESGPNGLRVNQGAYGGLATASRSRTNAWLLATTMNDGGVLRGTNTMRWLSGNLAATSTVAVQYSTNAGTAWITVATGVAATNGTFAWSTVSVTNSLTTLWRVVADGATNVQDASDASFAIRNAPLLFYVNNTQTLNDVFTTAVGAPGNTGLSPGSPKDTVMSILTTYDTEGGDTVFVDTGVYALTGDVSVIWSRGGDATVGSLLLRGSTNLAAGGTVFSRGSTNAGMGVDVRASYVTLRDLAVRDALYGVHIASNRQVRLERFLAYSNQVGVVVTQTVNATVVNGRFWNNRQGGVEVSGSRTSVIENCTFVGNEPFSARVMGSLDSVLQNNIFVVTSTNAPSALAGSASDIFIDYNIYSFETNAAIFGTNTSLLAWQLASGHDYRSSVTNPMLANAAAGDFHERSVAGRYVDGTGFVADAVNSWALDRGNPASAYSNEIAPNGARINIGAYGNTAFAGKGTTNALIELRILNDPTSINETNSLWPLVWTSQNIPTNEPFRIQFSGDGGTNWVDLQAGATPYGEVFLWQTTPDYNTYRGRWRVVGQNNTNFVDVNDHPFRIFYGDYAISSELVTTGGLSQIVWRGAWGENYRVQYATNPVSANGWSNAPNGPGLNQKAVFFSTNGGDFIYQDIGSVSNRHRLYRVVQDQY